MMWNRRTAFQLNRIGCGALGSAQAEALARAGLGWLRIVDRDFVEGSNLQRQTMFTERDAADRLRIGQLLVRSGSMTAQS